VSTLFAFRPLMHILLFFLLDFNQVPLIVIVLCIMVCLKFFTFQGLLIGIGRLICLDEALCQIDRCAHDRDMISLLGVLLETQR